MRRTSAVLALLAVAACGSSPTGPGGGGGGGADRLTASVDGQAFTATTIIANPVAATPGSLSFTGILVAGNNTTRSISINMAYIPGPGTYTLGMNTGTSAGGTATYISGTTQWMTPLSGAAGTITISTLSATRVVGTFTFTGSPILGGGANAAVTNGSFDVPRSTGYTPPPADNGGSFLRATINGNLSNAATVVGLGGGSDTRVLGGTNLLHSISITLGPFTAPTSGPISALTVPIRRITVQLVGTTQAWGGTAADVGTMTITSITPTRITGAFSGTLAPNAQASGSLTITGGVFDVRTPTP